MRTRRDVWKLDEWNPILEWYARGIAEMQKRPINNSLSWRYQAAIHEYIRSRDPFADPADALPSSGQRRRFWSQCQHNSWFFLPWHRMYLLHFERIVAATIKQLGGPDDWALPYWNYSDTSNPNARRLPPAFRATSLPDGSPNPLRIEDRVPEANNGDEIAADFEVDLSTCLLEESFISAPFGGDPGFGGRRTAFNHSGGAMGDVERIPHGSMHVAVGGNTGWMSGFNTAGLDPIFWLHHCNIDRLWSVWIARDLLHKNPNQAAWLTNVKFEFHDATGAEVTMTSSQMVDTKAAPLLYEYEDISDPIGVIEAVEAVERPMEEERPVPEMVGATEQPVTLTGETTSTSLPISAPAGPAAGLESTEAPKRVHLNLENITSTGKPTSYLVYLNLPPGGDPAEHRDHFAGLLPMFGVAEATEATDEHPGGGLHYSLDITNVVRTLEAKNDWDPNNMRVTFVPRVRSASQLESPEESSPVQVGRVSLYYS